MCDFEWTRDYPCSCPWKQDPNCKLCHDEAGDPYWKAKPSEGMHVFTSNFRIHVHVGGTDKGKWVGLWNTWSAVGEILVYSRSFWNRNDLVASIYRYETRTDKVVTTLYRRLRVKWWAVLVPYDHQRLYLQPGNALERGISWMTVTRGLVAVKKLEIAKEGAGILIKEIAQWKNRAEDAELNYSELLVTVTALEQVQFDLELAARTLLTSTREVTRGSRATGPVNTVLRKFFNFLDHQAEPELGRSGRGTKVLRDLVERLKLQPGYELLWKAVAKK